MKKNDAARESMKAKARTRHSRKHPNAVEAAPPADTGLMTQVQDAVTGAAQAVGRAAMHAVDAVKGAVGTT
ncbi:MAG: hypothetical protein K2X38_11765 [Gemmataceae bacterium]|nr:hypothetical protein [Gemmataceae bacterium]